MEIKFKKLRPDATAPRVAYATDAAFDLFAVEAQSVVALRHTLNNHPQQGIETGIALDIPAGFCGVIKGRSGLARDKGLVILGGVIDAGYRGEIIVLAASLGETVQVQPGDKIAQLMILPVPQVTLAEVPEFSAYSARGVNGFGSTDQSQHGPIGQPGLRGPGPCPAGPPGFARGEGNPGPQGAVAASTGLFTPPQTFEVGKSHREAAWDVLEERSRQRAKGFDATHDASHEPYDLLSAAHAYLLATDAVFNGERAEKLPGNLWPWPEGFKASPDVTRNAIKAAALLVAFVDRLRQAHDENRVPVNPAEREDTNAR